MFREGVSARQRLGAFLRSPTPLCQQRTGESQLQLQFLLASFWRIGQLREERQSAHEKRDSLLCCREEIGVLTGGM